MTMPVEGAPPINANMDRAHAAIATVGLVAGILTGHPLPIVVGVGLWLMLIAARSDYRRYAITDIGRYERLQNRGVVADGATCDVCDGVADGGQETRRFTELVAAGIVIRRYNVRSRYYCDEHAGVAVANDLTKYRSQGLGPDLSKINE